MALFAPDHIFVVSGHGSHLLNIPDEDKRYRLKDNEFYASSSICGYIGRATTQLYKNKIKFITSEPNIIIPHNEMESFHTLGDVAQLLQTSQTENINNRNNEEKIYINPSHKIHVPFSTKIASSTIPNENINLLTKWDISFNLIKGKRNTRSGEVSKKFNFEGKSYTISSGKDQIWYMNISGLLNAGNEDSRSAEQMAALKSKSDALIEALGIELPENDGLQIVVSSLVVVVPIGILYDDLLTTDYPDDPLAQYFKDAYLAVNADAIFLQGFSINHFKSEHALTLEDIMFTSYSIADIYSIIQDAYGSEKPVLLINDLCRNPDFKNLQKSRALATGNMSPNMKANVRKQVLRNRAFSINESNIRSYNVHNTRRINRKPNRNTRKRGLLTGIPVTLYNKVIKNFVRTQ